MTDQPNQTKPLGHKAYGSIPHLPGSRRGPADHGLSVDQARICLERPRDAHDFVYVQEKLDGSCCAVAKLHGQLVPLIRAGYLARSSPFSMHHAFHAWVMDHWRRFDRLLQEGERCVGEWLLQAHGTYYSLPHEPFVIFDLMASGRQRLPLATVEIRCQLEGFKVPMLIHAGPPGVACSIEEAMRRLQTSGHGAMDPVEGAVWRVERKGKVDFLAKFVRPDKVDGQYLPERTGNPPVWNRYQGRLIAPPEIS